MKGVVCLNGEWLDRYDFESDSLIIACDAGYNYLKKRGIVPNIILGDFDSLGYVPEGALVYPCDKDYTDGELALIKCHELSVSDVDFICAGGKRDDQFFANIGLLGAAKSMGIRARTVTNAGVIYFLNDRATFDCPCGAVVSVYALENSVIKSSSGLKYVYDNTELKVGSSLGISNVALSDKFSLELSYGAVLVFINNFTA